MLNSLPLQIHKVRNYKKINDNQWDPDQELLSEYYHQRSEDTKNDHRPKKCGCSETNFCHCFFHIGLSWDAFTENDGAQEEDDCY